MNLVENQPNSTSSIAEPAPLNDDDHYHSDDGNPDEEKLQPMRVNYHPSPSPPPAVPLPQVSPDSSPEPPSPSRNGSNIRLKPKIRPSQGDAVLVSFLGNGNRADVARIAGQEPLPSESDEEDMSLKGATSVDMEVRPAEEIIAAPQFDLAALGALAAGALAQGDVNVEEQEDSVIDPALRELSAETNEAPKSHPIEGRGEGEPMEDIKPTVPAITATLAEGTRRPNTPDLKVKTELLSPKARPVQIDGAVTSTAGELPPILQSPGIVSSDRWVGKLPSITDQLGNLNHVGTPQSPPGRPGPPGFPPMGHGSPPKSPNDTFRRELPSPGRVPGGYGGWRRPSQVDTNYTSGGDYSSSTAETPSTDQSGSTPAMMGIDRMSIDNMTNPQIGGFQCTYPGCNAQPFQTQVSLISSMFAFVGTNLS